ncbi:MAG: thioredoxin-disulfide reductase [Oligoflexales bacterium]
MNEKIEKVVIVGTGPAGLTAAIYAARAALEPVLFAGLQHGGQLTTTTEVENFPGFAKGILGPHLMQEMTEQAERFGTRIIYDEVTNVDLSGPVKTVIGATEKIKTRALIIATGATAKTMSLPHEAKLMGKGVSTCATCDGFFYKGKDVVVIGGGDSAMEEATYLAKLCRNVTLVHRRDTFRASPIMLKRAQNVKNIEFMVPYAATELLHSHQGLTGVKVENMETGAQRVLEVDGLFYAIGHKPNSEIFLPYVDLDKNGYIKVENFTKTKTPGVFAAGDIADPTFKQAITAAAMGCQAAIQTQHYLDTLD